MKKQTIIASVIASGALGLAIGAIALSTFTQPVNSNYTNMRNVNGQNRVTPAASMVSTIADQDLEDLEATLSVLIQDEYKARAEYVALVEKFGEVAPFVNLIQAETQHIAALTNQFTLYGFEVPVDNGSQFAVVPASLEAAYAIGQQAEIANIALYENFLKQELPVGIERVFTNLMKASENHLSTFQAYIDGKVTADHTPINLGGNRNGNGRSF